MSSVNNSNKLVSHKVRSENSKSCLKTSTSSSSLLGRTRKISSESQKSRPLKRATSLSYRVFTPTQMVIPTDLSLNRSQSLFNRPSKTQLAESKKTPAVSSNCSSTCVSKFRRRLRSLKRSSSSTSLPSLHRLPNGSSSSNLSSPIEALKSEGFSVNNLVSPPSSSVESSENESEEPDTSCFSHSSNSDTRDSSFQFSHNVLNTSSSCESSPASPEKKFPKFKFNFGGYLNRDILEDVHAEADTELDDIYDSENDLGMINDLPTLASFTSTAHSDNGKDKQKQCHQIFEIPEILEIILRHVAHDYTDKIPVEPKMNRRPPLSYNHSLMIYGEERGKKIWSRTVSGSSMNSLPSATCEFKSGVLTSEVKKNPNLYNCLFVNRNWYFTMLSILNENLFFKTDSQFENFTSSLCTSDIITPEPFSLVLHKIKSPQSVMDIFATQISSRRLKWLEFYICPAILPPINFISHSLKKLALPGCRSLTDDHLKLLVSKAPKLLHLDIRACDQITDASLYFTALNCPKLEMLNCGRHTRGELISDVSIGMIAKHCQIRTIGLAGCGISDWAVWELALHCGSRLKRLSLNYCWKLSDVGICRVLRAGLMETLSVLEVRGLALNDVRDIVHWKRRRSNNKHTVLIEACENLDRMMRNVETQLDLEISSRIFNDIDHWLQASEDESEGGDVDYRRFLNERRAIQQANFA